MPNMELKPSQYFYLLMEKPLGQFFQVQSPYYQMAQYNQKTPLFMYPEGDRSGLEKAKKGRASTLIIATTNVHLPKSVLTHLMLQI